MRFLRTLLVLSLLSAGCHAPTTVQTPQGKIAFTADQIAIRVGELQNTAIQANATGALPEATTRTIVTFCVQAAMVLQSAPGGWQAIVANSWKAAKIQIPPQTNPAIIAAMSAVDAVLAAYGS